MKNAARKTLLGGNKYKVSIAVFILFFMIGAYIVSRLNAAEKEADAAHTEQIASGYASSIEKVIHHALSSTNTLAVMVHQANGQVENYPDLARYMLPMYKGAYALSIAPDGVMRQIEPAIQNQAVLNHDLFEHQDREAEIKKILEGELKFFGPFKLIQGPLGAIGMLPVFLNDAQGEKYFWGYTLVSLKFPDAFEDVQLNDLEKQGYAYELVGNNPEKNNQREVIQRSKEALSTNPIVIPIQLYGTEWQLSVSKSTHINSFNRLLFEYLLIFFGASLMAWLAYSLLTLSEQRAKLNAIAMFDPLTSLPNRRLLDIKLDGALHKAEEDQTGVVVCYVDLDGFKDVNDRLGHDIGDELLKIVSARLKSCLRDNDVIARVGGDEFVIVLTEIFSIDEAQLVMQRIIDVVNQPLFITGEEAHVTASLGAAIYQKNGDEAEQLLRSADQAMYIAKKSGKNQFFFANDEAQ
ncbi:sensor domain-containing diguanylate cyclase [Acinetobacter sp. 194]|uniref:sensor domain-containing diguanylate cyclase n=1 Tax=Acinetobacter shaoyimingii TaxID=2715164 RepID=UPI001408BF5F|nr:sensor domain-containing diguanylate cyclase [Acinetobacter shaoyimingii]NHB58838.1 sensor domain-containing diguanylate cyclase [Acinetobacter shaoyimingii]